MTFARIGIWVLCWLLLGIGIGVAAHSISRKPEPQRQTITISGRVVDEDGNPVPGVTIRAITFGDFDQDGDVDLADYQVFQTQFSGPSP